WPRQWPTCWPGSTRCRPSARPRSARASAASARPSCWRRGGRRARSRAADRGSVAALLLDPGVEHRPEFVAGATDGLLHGVGVVAGAHRVVVLQARLQRAALVVDAGLDRGVAVGQEDLDPAQPRKVAAELLLEHRVDPLLERVGAVDVAVGVQLDDGHATVCLIEYQPRSYSACVSVRSAAAPARRPPQLQPGCFAAWRIQSRTPGARASSTEGILTSREPSPCGGAGSNFAPAKNTRFTDTS